MMEAGFQRQRRGSGRHRKYEGIDLVPGGPPVSAGGNLNLWRGFGVDPKQGDWRLMERHIYEVPANGDEEFARYIINHTAWKLQNPGELPQVLLALTGGSGAGKSIFGHTLLRIFGQHGLYIGGTPDLLTGDFNGHLQNKLFLYLDEVLWAGNKRAEQALKSLITEPMMMINPKQVGAHPWRNRMGIFMTGNEKWIVPASHDSRRFAVNKVSNVYAQRADNEEERKKYFTPLWATMMKGDGASAMLYALLRRDLKDWHPRDNVPQTKTLTEQKVFSLGGKEEWYLHILETGQLPTPLAKKEHPRWGLSKVMFEDAKRYSPMKNKYLNETEFGRFLGEECGCEHKSNGQAWGWVFRPLCEHRAAWITKFGEWDWTEPDLVDWSIAPGSVTCELDRFDGNEGGPEPGDSRSAIGT